MGFVVTGAAALCALVASVLIGSLVAMLFSQSPRIRVALQPYVVFLQTVPIVAIAPIFDYLVWLSIHYGDLGCHHHQFVSHHFERHRWTDFCRSQPCRAVSVGRCQSTANVDQADGFLCRQSSGSWDAYQFWESVIGAIIGELFVSSGPQYSGLGNLMRAWQNQMKTDALIAVVFASTLLGLVMLVLVNLLSRTVLRRWTSSSGFEMSQR